MTGDGSVGEHGAGSIGLAPAVRGVGATRIWLGCALAALSAALLTLSFAPYNVWWLVWVAVVPMVVAQYRVLPAAWSALGPALGIGGFMAGYFGGVFPASAAWYMKALPLIVAVIIFVASRGGRAARDRRGYAAWPLTAAATWVALELVRMFVPALGTWGFLGYALYRQDWLLQPVRVVGIFGLDLLIMLVNYAVAMAVIARLDRRASFEAPVDVAPRHAVRWLGGVLAALAVWGVFSLSARRRGDATIRVAALQPGVRRLAAGKTSAARDRAMLDRLSAQTREAAARGARLAVWPEGAFAVDPATEYASNAFDFAQ